MLFDQMFEIYTHIVIEYRHNRHIVIEYRKYRI